MGGHYARLEGLQARHRRRHRGPLQAARSLRGDAARRPGRAGRAWPTGCTSSWASSGWARRPPAPPTPTACGARPSGSCASSSRAGWHLSLARRGGAHPRRPRRGAARRRPGGGGLPGAGVPPGPAARALERRVRRRPGRRRARRRIRRRGGRAPAARGARQHQGPARLRPARGRLQAGGEHPREGREREPGPAWTRRSSGTAPRRRCSTTSRAWRRRSRSCGAAATTRPCSRAVASLKPVGRSVLRAGPGDGRRPARSAPTGSGS